MTVVMLNVLSKEKIYPGGYIATQPKRGPPKLSLKREVNAHKVSKPTPGGGGEGSGACGTGFRRDQQP